MGLLTLLVKLHANFCYQTNNCSGFASFFSVLHLYGYFGCYLHGVLLHLTTAGITDDGAGKSGVQEMDPIILHPVLSKRCNRVELESLSGHRSRSIAHVKMSED